MYKWLTLLFILLITEMLFKEVAVLSAIPLFSAGMIVCWYQLSSSKYPTRNFFGAIVLYSLLYSFLMQLNPGVYLIAFGLTILLQNAVRTYFTSAELILICLGFFNLLGLSLRVTGTMVSLEWLLHTLVWGVVCVLIINQLTRKFFSTKKQSLYF
jgi:hypothetical protein